MSKRDPFALSEAQFQAQIIEYAQLNRWLAYSIPDSRRATERGYPDLTLLHVGIISGKTHLAFCELKTDTGRVRREQRDWLDALSIVAKAANKGAGYAMVKVFLWRPSMWNTIQEYLEGHDWPQREAA